MPGRGQVTKFTLNPLMAALPSADLADGLVAMANDLRDELADGQIVATGEIMDGLRAAVLKADGDQRLLLLVAIAFLDAGFLQR